MAIIEVTKARSLPSHRSRMNGLNFSLFSVNCGAKGVAVLQAPTSFARSMNHQGGARVDEARVARAEPSLGVMTLARGLVVLR